MLARARAVPLARKLSGVRSALDLLTLRWLAAVGPAPIPGPLDEALLLIVAIPLAPFYRGPLAEAWTRSDIAKPS